MNNLHIENSYNIWSIEDMNEKIHTACLEQLGAENASQMLNRSYGGMYIEWWLHNIGYYLTSPFCFIDALKTINQRCKDVDIDEIMF